ncbi:plasmid partitioning protein RepB C-terminal domain-containing protein [Roseiarcaceae bacterium H3SJ34-1]|uniref:plasmid partitioning protein RepB C-terminal domain-containing protein n=1 Tax=Terripilifer ovatus TaxID=3032367 RepID=UPI003AB92A6A|nr:plasmid partitioning protein RepB C-terminal domain-containing protein [Roseiarcaceae bacterium H3SJ34-1]
MNRPVHHAFEGKTILVPTAEVLPQRQVTDALRASSKYKKIVRSIAEIGLVEPLVVSRLARRAGGYLLLDGHIRLAAFAELGIEKALCLVSDDDEAFTYNKRLSRLATIQEHFMIVQALKRGVSEDKLARVLDVDIQSIKRRRTLLDRICPEVVDFLKDRRINPAIFDVLRKMKPLRQIEASELMATAGNFSSSYAKALLAATKQVDLAKPDVPKSVGGLSVEQMAKMEREMESLQSAFKQVESSYGDDVLHLVIATGYLAKLIGNREIERYLRKSHSEILEKFKEVIAATSLDQSSQIAA